MEMEEDISLPDILRSIWRGKLIIIIVTCASLLLGGSYAWLIKPVKYQVSTSLMMITPVDKQQPTPQKDLTPYGEQIKMDYELAKIKAGLHLDNYSLSKLREMIEIDVPINSNTIGIKVTDSDPSMAARISNALVIQLSNFIEISNIMDIMTTDSKSLLDTNDSLVGSEAELNQLKIELSKTPEKIIVRKSLGDDPLLLNLIGNGDQTASILLNNEERNPVFTNLTNKIAEVEVLVSKMKSEKTLYENRTKENQDLISEIQTQIQSSETSKNYIQQTNHLSSVLITPTDIPKEAIDAGIFKILALWGVFGLIIGIISALAYNSLKKEKTDLNDNKLNTIEGDTK